MHSDLAGFFWIGIGGGLQILNVFHNGLHAILIFWCTDFLAEGTSESNSFHLAFYVAWSSGRVTVKLLGFKLQKLQKAASVAAKATSPAQQKAASSTTGAIAVDWSKLVSKPPVFEHATTEAETKGFRDWSWQMCQYLATIDANYDEELRKLFDDPSKGLDMSSASSHV